MNSVFVKFKLNLFVLSEVNIPTTDFEHKILLWQMLSITIPTIQSTAYNLPVSYLWSQMEWSVLCHQKQVNLLCLLNWPVTRRRVHTSLSSAHLLSIITINHLLRICILMTVQKYTTSSHCIHWWGWY